MSKTILISLVTLFIGLAFTACNHASTNIATIEPTVPPEIQTDISPKPLGEPAPTDINVVPTETQTIHSGPLPGLQSITIENAEDVHELRTLEIPEHTPRLYSQCGVAFSPDGRLLVGTCGSNPMPVWDVQTGAMLFQLYQDKPKQIIACDFSPDGSIIACGGIDKIITFWNAETGEKKSEFGEHDSKIWDLEFSPDGDSVVTASFSNDIRVWDVATQEMTWNFNKITKFLSVAYNPSGDSIAYGNVKGKIGVLDAKTGKNIVELSGPPGTPVGDVNFSPSGKLLSAGSDDKKIYLWETQNYQPVATLEGHDGYVNGVNFNPDETLLISGSHDKTVGIWDFSAGKLLKKLEGHKDVVLRVAFNPQGTLIASISWDGTVRLWGITKE